MSKFNSSKLVIRIWVRFNQSEEDYCVQVHKQVSSQNLPGGEISPMQDETRSDFE